MCTCLCVCTWAWVCRSEQNLRSWSPPSTLFKEESLCSLQCTPDLLALQFGGFLLSLPPISWQELWKGGYCSWLLHGLWGFEPRSLYLHGKYSTSWAISPAHPQHNSLVFYDVGIMVHWVPSKRPREGQSPFATTLPESTLINYSEITGRFFWYKNKKRQKGRFGVSWWIRLKLILAFHVLSDSGVPRQLYSSIKLLFP